MKSRWHYSDDPQFNLTAMIDVVFLLIIFFMLICQFIVQENYKLLLPDDCPGAIVPDHPNPQAITVSVFRRPGGAVPNRQHNAVLYAVRSERIDPSELQYQDNPDLLVQTLAARIAASAGKKKDLLVHLRADKNLTYGDVQDVLLALARARINKVQLAAFRSAQEKK